MTVMGLDLSLTGTGLVILDAEARILEHVAIQVGGRGMDRVIAIEEAIRRRLSGMEVALVAIEGYAYGVRRRQSHLADLAELGGVVKRRLIQEAVPYVVISPAAVKKFATGKGNAGKDKVAVAAYKKWKVEFETADEVDAYVLARMALALLTKHDVCKYEEEALANIKSGYRMEEVV